MTTIVDSGVIVAVGDPRDEAHSVASRWLATTGDQLVVPQPVTCEVDHLLLGRGRDAARSAFVRDLAVGRFESYCLTGADWSIVADLAGRYADLSPGLSDLSIVVATERHATTRIATFDMRHFRAITAVGGTPFTLLPADA